MWTAILVAGAFVAGGTVGFLLCAVLTAAGESSARYYDQ